MSPRNEKPKVKAKSGMDGLNTDDLKDGLDEDQDQSADLMLTPKSNARSAAVRQVCPLFYSFGFFHFNKCVSYKRTIKLCVSCC